MEEQVYATGYISLPGEGFGLLERNVEIWVFALP